MHTEATLKARRAFDIGTIFEQWTVDTGFGKALGLWFAVDDPRYNARTITIDTLWLASTLLYARVAPTVIA